MSRWVAALERMGDITWLHQRLAFQGIQDAPQDGESWERLVELLPRVQEDPILLEQIMLLALERLIEAQEHPQLGHQEWSPIAPYLFEECLHSLLTRHGHGRIAWDREAPVLYLLRQGRFENVLHIIQSLPFSDRSAHLCEAEAIALRREGRLRNASEALAASLAKHPRSFRLWMEQFHASMADQHMDRAKDSLEKARKTLGDPVPEGLQERLWEWMLNRAEFAFWIEGDAGTAMDWLEQIPEPTHSSNPHLLMQLQLALGHFEASFKQSEAFLKQHPGNVDALLVQAESMAGMEAWEALAPFLEQIAEKAQQRPDYWHMKGLCLTHANDFARAREHLERAAQMDMRNLRIVLDAGHGCMDTGEYYRAEQHWRQALKIDAKNEEALVQLAETRKALLDPESARRLLRECLLHHPDSESAQSFLAELEAH